MQTDGLFPGCISLQTFTTFRYRYDLTIERILRRSHECSRSKSWQTENDNSIGQSRQITFFVINLPGTENYFCSIAFYITRNRHDPVRLYLGLRNTTTTWGNSSRYVRIRSRFKPTIHIDLTQTHMVSGNRGTISGRHDNSRS